MYQEIIQEYRPDWIIETGTFTAGSAIFLADMCAIAGHGRVLTVDVRRRPSWPNHPRLTYITGSSIDIAVLDYIRKTVPKGARTLAILDSLHKASYVRAEMEAYAEFVPIGGYLIVEDTNLGGHPVWPQHGPGPLEAVQDFLGKRREFVVDREREKFMLTFNRGGYLRRTA